MEETELRQALSELERKIDATHQSAEKTRKYILVFVVVSVAAFVLPLIGLAFAIPSFISTYASLGGL